MQLRPFRPKHLAGCITLEQAVHKQELRSSFHRFPPATWPFLRIERGKRPQGLYRGHERAMVDRPDTISFLRLAVPSTIITLMLHKPFKHLSNSTIVLKPELCQCPCHVAGYTGLPDQTPPSQILIRILWRRPRSVLSVHNSKKILAAFPDRRMCPRDADFSQQY